MKKMIVISAVLLFFATNLFSQNKTRDFELIMPDQKISNSLYKYIGCIDSRPDTSNLGIIQVGLMNAKARLIPKTPFRVQLSRLVDSLTDSTASNGRLLLQLKHFNFAEVTGSFSEKGYFYFRDPLCRFQWPVPNNRFDRYANCYEEYGRDQSESETWE